MILIGEEVIDVPSVEELHGTVLSHAEDLRNHDRVIADLEERVRQLIVRTEENGGRQQIILASLAELRGATANFTEQQKSLHRHVDETRNTMNLAIELLNSHIATESHHVIEWAEKQAAMSERIGNLALTVGENHAKQMASNKDLNTHMNRLVMIAIVAASLLGGVLESKDLIATLSGLLGLGG